MEVVALLLSLLWCFSFNVLAEAFLNLLAKSEDAIYYALLYTPILFNPMMSLSLSGWDGVSTGIWRRKENQRGRAKERGKCDVREPSVFFLSFAETEARFPPHHQCYQRMKSKVAILNSTMRQLFRRLSLRRFVFLVMELLSSLSLPSMRQTGRKKANDKSKQTQNVL